MPTQHVPVADTPSPNAPTYAQLVTTADAAGTPFVDDETPTGHFGVVVHNIGGFQTYWFAGDPSDPDQARVVARTQDQGHGRAHYVGGSFLGGTLT